MSVLDPNDKVVDYIQKVCSQIKCHEIHSDIRLELQSHIHDLTDEFVQTGASQEEAVDSAIRQMGDPRVLGSQLHRAHQPRTEWSLLAAVAAFISIGINDFHRIFSL